MENIKKILDLKADEIYHYNNWNKSIIENSNLHSISLKWCEFIEIDFIKCILANSDWEGCRALNCLYSGVSFENSDITSIYFENCEFNKVTFKGATTTDVSFINCKFINCDFNHIVLNSSSFKNCTFTRFKLRQSSTYLNQFIDCVFDDSYIYGNFMYNLFINAHFNKTDIASDLMSSNFGFTDSNLKELSLEKTYFKQLQQKLLDNKDYVSAAIISLNLEEKAFDNAILISIQVIIEQLRCNILVRNEQLMFFSLILNRLLNENKLSLYMVLFIINILEQRKLFANNIALEKSESVINQIHNMLFEHYRKIIKDIDSELNQIKSKNSPLTLKITYVEEPSIPICSLLIQIMNAVGINGAVPIRKETAKGSFIEWIKCYDNILKCLQLFISILGLQIKLKKNNSAEDHSESESKATENNEIEKKENGNVTNSLVFQIPESVLHQLDSVQTEKDVSKVINIFVLNGVSVNNNFQGYNNFNVQKIEFL